MALAGQVLDPAAVVAGHRGAAAAADRRPARLARRGRRARSPNRTDRRPTPARPRPRAPRRRRRRRRHRTADGSRPSADGRRCARCRWSARRRAVRREHVADADRAAVGAARGPRTRAPPTASASRRSLPSRCTCRRESRRARRARERRPRGSDRPARPRRRCASRRRRPRGAAAAAAASSCVSPPRTTMMWLHFLQRILKTFPRTLSSEIEYLVPQESQMIFINASIRRSRRPTRTFDEGAIALPLAGTGQPIILRLAAPCKRGGADFPGIPQLKLAVSRFASGSSRQHQTVASGREGIARQDGLRAARRPTRSPRPAVRPAPPPARRTAPPPWSRTAAMSDDVGRRPAFELLVDRLGRGQVVDVERHLVQRSAPPTR